MESLKSLFQHTKYVNNCKSFSETQVCFENTFINVCEAVAVGVEHHDNVSTD